MGSPTTHEVKNFQQLYHFAIPLNVRLFHCESNGNNQKWVLYSLLTWGELKIKSGRGKENAFGIPKEI